MSLNFPHGERFLPYGEKNLSRELVQDTYVAIGAKRRTLYFFNFNVKNEHFKILNPSPVG
jgi:hypothetical protein